MTRSRPARWRYERTTPEPRPSPSQPGVPPLRSQTPPRGPSVPAPRRRTPPQARRTRPYTYRIRPVAHPAAIPSRTTSGPYRTPLGPHPAALTTDRAWPEPRPNTSRWAWSRPTPRQARRAPPATYRHAGVRLATAVLVATPARGCAYGRLRLAVAPASAGGAAIRQTGIRLAARASWGRSRRRGRAGGSDDRGRIRRIRRPGSREARGVGGASRRAAHHLRAGAGVGRGGTQGDSRRRSGRTRTGALRRTLPALGCPPRARLPRPAGTDPPRSAAAQTRATGWVRAQGRSPPTATAARPLRPYLHFRPARVSTAGKSPRCGRAASTRRSMPGWRVHRAPCGCRAADRA